MIRLEDSKYYYDEDTGMLFREVKNTKQGYHLRDATGKLRWYSQDRIKRDIYLRNKNKKEI